MIGRLAAGTATLGAACLAYATVEARQFQLRRYTVPVLPAGADPVRVLHLSDLHLLASQRRKASWVHALAELEPDLVVNTGDNHAGTRAWPAVLQAYGRLLDVPGVFVWGSNDYHAPKLKNPAQYLAGPSRVAEEEHRELPWRRLQTAFTAAGWLELTNARAELTIKGLRFAFRGTDDPHLKLDRYDMIAGPDNPEAQVRVGVTHAPYLRVLDPMAADGMDLIFAGHTHGGQVCVPGYGALVTNCDLDTGRVKGLSTHTAGGHTAALEVSAGLGTSPFSPYRLACPPEASLLTLTPRTRG